MIAAKAQPGHDTAIPKDAPRLGRALRDSASLCNRCGFCLPVCPTYRLTLQEAASPRGRLDLMYAVAQGEMALGSIEGALSLCLGCMACQTACPSGIPFARMLEAGRGDAARGGPKSPLVRLLIGPLLGSPRALRFVAWALYLYQRTGLQFLLRASHLLNLLAPPLARQERGLPPLPRPRRWRGEKEQAQGQAREQGSQGGDGTRQASLLSGCVMDAVFGEVHQATVTALRQNGYRVNVPENQGCCGALQFHAGAEEMARSLARRNIAAFEESGEAVVVVNSAGCGAMMKQYGELLAGDSEWRERAEHFSGRVQDISEALGTELAPPPPGPALRVAYDDPCHLLHAQGVSAQPRAMLAAIPGVELVELPEASWCCGSAGSYSLLQPEMSRRVLERKMEHIEALGVDVVATGNPGCLLQLALGARERGLALRIVHPVQLLAEAYEKRGKKS